MDGRTIQRAPLMAELEAAVNDAGEKLAGVYPPVLEYGGHYSVRGRDVAAANTTPLPGTVQYDAVVCSLGCRYRHQCANICRTLLFNGSASQRRNYAFLLHLRQAVLRVITVRMLTAISLLPAAKVLHSAAFC